jgi:hypothetical protein
VVTLIAVAVLAIAIAVVTANANSGRHPTPAGGGASDVLTTPALPSNFGSEPPTASATNVPSVTRLASPPETPTSAPPAPAALSVIDAWGRAWVNHPVGMTNAQWLAQLKPYTTQEFLPVMDSVDVANIDATQITGQPRATKSYTSSVEALLPTNGGELDITAIATPGGWLVSEYTEAG